MLTAMRMAIIDSRLVTNNRCLFASTHTVPGCRVGRFFY